MDRWWIALALACVACGCAQDDPGRDPAYVRAMAEEAQAQARINARKLEELEERVEELEAQLAQ